MVDDLYQCVILLLELCFSSYAHAVGQRVAARYQRNERVFIAGDACTYILITFYLCFSKRFP